jgi:hypothetical protein
MLATDLAPIFQERFTSLLHLRFGHLARRQSSGSRAASKNKLRNSGGIPRRKHECQR